MHNRSRYILFILILLAVVSAGVVIYVRESTSSLYRLAAPYNVKIGSAVSGGQLDDKKFVSVLTRDFNLITPENAMKFESVSPAAGVYNFTEADKIVEFAQKHNLSVRGHTLVWANQLPDWLLSSNYSREEYLNILHTHIQTVVWRYRGKVQYWDVVNEALANDGSIAQDNYWMQKIGPEYIPLAFQWAHEADPDALLFYNDSYAEGKNPKAEGVFTLVKSLQEQGVPIHGVGFEMHTGIGWSPDPIEFTANISRLANLGLLANITEMDVRIEEPATPGELLRQAKIFKDIFNVCLEASNCTVFSTWGLTDANSWIPDVYPGTGSPLLFFSDYAPKPAYDALIELLEGRKTP
jgi:endo-1,4-beta-xylanase